MTQFSMHHFRRCDLPVFCSPTTSRTFGVRSEATLGLAQFVKTRRGSRQLANRRASSNSPHCANSAPDGNGGGLKRNVFGSVVVMAGSDQLRSPGPVGKVSRMAVRASFGSSSRQ